jgi:hypothetical protein
MATLKELREQMANAATEARSSPSLWTRRVLPGRLSIIAQFSPAHKSLKRPPTAAGTAPESALAPSETYLRAEAAG